MANTQRIAVAALTKGYTNKAEYNMLISRNKALQQVREPDMTVDYLLFHEGNISIGDQQYIRDATPDLDIKFIDVSFEFAYKPSENGKTSGMCKPSCTSDAFSTGYKTMCRFWLHRFLEYTSEYDYVVRIDEDCVVRSLPLSSMVKDMQGSDNVYLTPCLMDVDGAEVVMGLNQLSTNFAKEHGLVNPVFNKNPYTNVFILDVNHFKGLAIFHEYCKRIDDTGCIYVNRWGDLPMWGIILSMMVPHSKWGVDPRLKYFHGSHFNHINVY